MTFTTFKPCTSDGKHISSQSDSDLDEVWEYGPPGKASKLLTDHLITG